jgi:peptide/nickel transport system permease protein
MRFVLRRLSYYAAAAWVAITINFALPRAMPGDPATTLFAKMQGQMQPEQIDNLKKAYGLTGGPLWREYLTYIQHVLRGDFGISFSSFPSPVLDVVGTGIAWTLLLGVVSVVLSFLLGTAIGAVSAWRHGGRLDSWAPPTLMFVGAFPHFFVALLISYVFALNLQWFPLSHAYDGTLEPGFNGPFVASVLQHLVLPGGTMILLALGSWVLRMRNSMIGILSEDYLSLAQAKGLRQRRIITQYAVRNALLPNITAFGMTLGFVLSGQILVEMVFSYPGLGYQLYQAVSSQDYPLMQALFLIITLAVLGANLLVDILYVRLDPRAS